MLFFLPSPQALLIGGAGFLCPWPASRAKAALGMLVSVHGQANLRVQISALEDHFKSRRQSGFGLRCGYVFSHEEDTSGPRGAHDMEPAQGGEALRHRRRCQVGVVSRLAYGDIYPGVVSTASASARPEPLLQVLLSDRYSAGLHTV